MSNSSNEPRITDMIRLVCMEAYGRGEMEFKFNADDMALSTARAEAAKFNIDDGEAIQNAANDWVDTHAGDIKAKFKSSFAVPIITRAFAKIGKVAKVSIGKDEDYNLQITVRLIEGEEPIKPKRKSQAKKQFNLTGCLDSFKLDVSKLKGCKITVDELAEVVEQVKAHIVANGGK